MDDFRRAQGDTGEWLKMREELHKDLQAMVRDEVRRVGYPEAHVEAAIGEIARKKVLEQQTSFSARLRRWSPVLVALAVVAGVEGWVHREGRPAETVVADTVPAQDRPEESALPVEAPSDDAPAAPSTPGARAAAFDDMLRTGSPALEEFVGSLLESGTPGVRAAAQTWLENPASISAAERLRVHSALLQQALNRTLGSTLTVDGQVRRTPQCGGSTCPQFLEVWRRAPEARGFPEFPTGGNPSEDELLAAERAWLYQVLLER